MSLFAVEDTDGLQKADQLLSLEEKRALLQKAETEFALWETQRDALKEKVDALKENIRKGEIAYEQWGGIIPNKKLKSGETRGKEEQTFQFVFKVDVLGVLLSFLENTADPKTMAAFQCIRSEYKKISQKSLGVC